MNTFRVGQRVRIKDVFEVHPESRGMEGIFYSYNPADAWENRRGMDCSVEIDGEICAGLSSCLEPLDKPKGLSIEEEMARLFERTDLVDFKARAKVPV